MKKWEKPSLTELNISDTAYGGFYWDNNLLGNHPGNGNSHHPWKPQPPYNGGCPDIGNGNTGTEYPEDRLS